MIRFLLLVAALTLAAPALAQRAGVTPGIVSEQEIRTAILTAQQAPDFRASDMQLEVYRTLRAAGVVLSSAEAFEMGDSARVRGNSFEAAAAFALLGSDDPEYLRNEGLIAHAQEQARQDRRSGMDQSIAAAQKRCSPQMWADVAEFMAGGGDDERAIEFYEHALNFRESDPAQFGDAEIDRRAAEASRITGRSIVFHRLELVQQRSGVSGWGPKQLTPAELVLVKLNYGISLYRLKRVAEARATWAAIDGNAAAGILAKAWIGIADRSAN